MGRVDGRRVGASAARIALGALLVAGLAAASVLAVPGELSSTEPSAADLSLPPDLGALPEHPRVLLIGDSFAEGYGASNVDAGWASIASRSLGWRTTFDAVGGTGYVKDLATDGRHGLDYPSRVGRHVRAGAEFDLVVLQGGLNDWRSTNAELGAAVATTVRSARAAWPGAAVVVFGPAEPLGDGVVRLEKLPAIRDAAEAEGALFIDTSLPEPWINAGNTEQFDLGDGLHLNDAGYAYLAARFVAAFEAHRADYSLAQ